MSLSTRHRSSTVRTILDATHARAHRPRDRGDVIRRRAASRSSASTPAAPSSPGGCGPLIEELTGRRSRSGEIDISFYRDDVGARPISDQPVVHSSRIDFPLEETTVVLVDDVLYTGRTARAAIEALFDYGRPDRVQLAVLVDRGHRELPIRPDYVGKNLPTSRAERVNVRLEESDGVDEVEIAEIGTEVEADEASAFDRRPLATRHRAHHDSRRELRRGRRARHQEGARRCAAARSSTSSTSRAPAPARRSSWPPSAFPRTS